VGRRCVCRVSRSVASEPKSPRGRLPTRRLTQNKAGAAAKHGAAHADAVAADARPTLRVSVRSRISRLGRWDMRRISPSHQPSRPPAPRETAGLPDCRTPGLPDRQTPGRRTCASHASMHIIPSNHLTLFPAILPFTSLPFTSHHDRWNPPRDVHHPRLTLLLSSPPSPPPSHSGGASILQTLPDPPPTFHLLPSTFHFYLLHSNFHLRPSTFRLPPYSVNRTTAIHVVHIGMPTGSVGIISGLPAAHCPLRAAP
jgi:hypothetical protein